MYSKIHTVQNSVVLACCEKELVGKVLKEGEYYLEIEDNFYKDKLIDDKELSRLLKEADNISLLGEKPVSVALKEGLIKDSDIIRIKGIPHVNIFKFASQI